MTRNPPLAVFIHERRRALRALVAAALLPAASTAGQTALLTPTPSQTEGPFYPKTIPADHDGGSHAYRWPRCRGVRTPLYFSGRVLSRDARARKQLRMALAPATSRESGALAGTFDFAIR